MGRLEYMKYVKFDTKFCTVLSYSFSLSFFSFSPFLSPQPATHTFTLTHVQHYCHTWSMIHRTFREPNGARCQPSHSPRNSNDRAYMMFYLQRVSTIRLVVSPSSALSLSLFLAPMRLYNLHVFQESRARFTHMSTSAHNTRTRRTLTHIHPRERARASEGAS